MVELEFPMLPRISRGFHDSATVEYGALVFSYGIGEDWLKLRNRGMTADWQVYPTTPWNYAISSVPERIKVVPCPPAAGGRGPLHEEGKSAQAGGQGPSCSYMAEPGQCGGPCTAEPG